MRLRVHILILILLFTIISCALKEVPETSNIANEEVEEQDLSVSNQQAYYHFSLSRLHLYRREYREALSEARIAEQISPESAALKYNLALVLISLNRFTEALAMLEKSIELNPNYDPAHKLLGRIYASSNDPRKKERAIEELSKSTEFDPKNSETFMFLGIVQSEKGDLDSAIKNFKKFIELAPRDERGYYFLGRVFYLKDMLDKAAEYLERAIELNPDYNSAIIDLALVYEKSGKFRETEEIYRSLINRYPRNMEIYLRYGNFLYRTNRKSDASRQYEKAQELDINNIDLKLRLALLYIDSKEYDNAIDQLRLILLGDPGNDRAKYYLALSYIETGSFDQAIELLNSIDVNSEIKNEVLIQKSYLYEKQGQVDKSINIVEEAYKSDPDNENIINYLGILYRNSKRHADAIKLFNNYLRSNPDNEALLYSLGVVYYMDEQEEKSISTMEKLIKINPEHSDALNFVGYYYADKGENLDKAMEYVTAALRISPNKGYIIDSLGWIYYKKGEIDKALELLLEAARLTSNDPEVMSHIGDVYMAKGDLEKALFYYEKGVEMLSDDAEEDNVARELKTKIDEIKNRIKNSK